MAKNEKLDLIVDSFIQDMEQGVGEWFQKWTIPSFCKPRNLTTQKPYRGINPFILAHRAKIMGYKNNQWLTYKQAIDLGGNIKKGEKGESIFFNKLYEQKVVEKDGTETIRKRWFLASYIVFNVEQTEGIKYDDDLPPIDKNKNIEAIDSFVDSISANIEHAMQDRAYYSPRVDKIMMPEKSLFKDMESYYSTLLHELVHWTLHSSRLNRATHQQKYDETYCLEELIAELGSAFLCSEFGVDLSKNQHPEYIQMYLHGLRNDKKMLWKAAKKAQEAFDYLISLSNSKLQSVA